MKYSSHLYYHTDGTFGRFPIVELDNTGRLISLTECKDTLTELAGIRFFAGIIVPYLVSTDEFVFHNKTEFCQMVNKRIDANNPDRIMLIEGFDLNTFDHSGMSIRELK